MFGTSLPSAAPDHLLGTSDQGLRPLARDPLSAPRRSERLERLERTITHDLVPHLMTSHRSGPPAPTAAPAATAADSRPAEAGAARPAVTADEVLRFVDLVRHRDDAHAPQFVRAMLATGVPVEAVYLDLLAPAARALGDMWTNDECDFVEVTVALGRMQRLLRDLSQLFLSEGGQTEAVGSVLLTCLPGEQHTLGIIMVGEFLLRDGWRVLVGAPWTEGDLLTMVGTEWYDVIGFSVGGANRLSTLRRDIRRLRAASRNPHIQIMVGGQVFADAPDLASSVGADANADSARDVPTVARALLAAARALAAAGTRSEALGAHGELSEASRRQ